VIEWIRRFFSAGLDTQKVTRIIDSGPVQATAGLAQPGEESPAKPVRKPRKVRANATSL
jgi:hypothetical protein